MKLLREQQVEEVPLNMMGMTDEETLEWGDMARELVRKREERAKEAEGGE